MDSEEAADLGVKPTTLTHPTTPCAPTTTTTPAAPTAPTSCKKSWKKKEKAEAREAAREGGDEAAGRVAAIEGLTRAGHRALALGAGREAVGCFRKALLLSRDMVSPQIHRACAFNLGAAYVETGKPKKGLEFLLQSQPSEAESRDHLGSLYFNVGAAHEGLRDFPKALECFEKVAGHASAAQAGGRAGTCVQMGCCYLGMREPARAARCFLDAAQTYAAAESPEAAAVALSRASGSMLQSRRFRAAEIARVLARCRSLCETIPDLALRGNAALHPSFSGPWGAAPTPAFPLCPQGNSTTTSASATPSSTSSPWLPRALSGPSGSAVGSRSGTGAGRLRCCRTWVLPTTPCAASARRWAGTGVRPRCTVLWGTGGLRGSALGTWRMPAASSGATELPPRTTCTPCKPSGTRVRGGTGTPLGGVCSIRVPSGLKLGDAACRGSRLSRAGTDAALCLPGDLQGQWQACEGLGSACFHLGDPQKAIGHYQEALILLSHCQDSPRAAHKRVVHKLTDAIQRRLRLSHLSYQGGWAPTPALEPSQLQFCSTLPRASRTRLQGSEVGKAQAADELLMCMPGACPRHSGTGVAPTGGLALEPCNPHGLLGTSGEDDDGPSSAPGYHSEPKVNSKRTTSPLHPAKPPHAGPRLRKYHTQPELGFPSEPRPVGLTLHSSGHQNHQTLHPRAPER
ncbi:tetratricopeptide repeat protein 24 isoform X1 [Corvus kubaryi]|uniref:tetratricopeptide repeat protein 24 isoform X1 n=1 Tax=Corvus kubaryi TaxID=68294 RepID=UPI001C03F1FE|nr:tetratricopeptide repeat protein 24 isoform X1 [Corvus kubaryi]